MSLGAYAVQMPGPALPLVILFTLFPADRLTILGLALVVAGGFMMQRTLGRILDEAGQGIIRAATAWFLVASMIIPVVIVFAL